MQRENEFMEEWSEVGRVSVFSIVFLLRLNTHAAHMEAEATPCLLITEFALGIYTRIKNQIITILFMPLGAINLR